MRYLTVLICIFMGVAALAQLDSADQEALQKTQELLRNKTERSKAIQTSESSQKVDKHVDSLFGDSSAAKEGIYDLAADIFADLVKQSGGDADKMQQLIQEYQRDPAAFAAKWSPEQKAKLKGLSEKVKVPAGNP